jgi:prophage regulatory protein
VEQKRQRKTAPTERRIIRRPEVRRRTGYSDTTIWRKEKEGTFPERVQLSSDGMAVGWYEDEVDAWIQSRIREPGKRPPPAKQAREKAVVSKSVNSVSAASVVGDGDGAGAHALRPRRRAAAAQAGR